MTKKKGRRIGAFILAVILIVGMMPMEWTIKKASAAETVYTFDASTETAITTAEKKAAIASGKYGTDSYFTLIHTLQNLQRELQIKKGELLRLP